MTYQEFTNKVTEHKDLLMGLAMHITRNRTNAEDLLQETLVRAFRSHEKFETGTNFKAWMSTIMRNTNINIYRRQKNRKLREVEITPAVGKLESQKTINEGPRSVFLSEMHGIFNSLDDKYAFPFCKFVEGYQYEEIADEMEIPVGTVKSRIFYARKQIKQKIDQNYDNIHALLRA